MASFFQRTAVRDWRGVTALFLVTTLLESLALGHLTAFTPLFLKTELGVPEDQVGPWTGFLTSMTFAVAFPLAPLWGSLAERYSRKLVIVRSQYIEACAYALCALAPNLGWLIGARLLLGLTFGNIAIVIATQSLLTPERRMASAISIVQAAAPIAASIGPPLGALALPFLGLRGLFFVDAAAALSAALLTTILAPEPPGRDRKKAVMANVRGSIAVVWRRPVLRWNFAGWYLSRGAMSVVDSYLPVRITELVPTNPAPAIGLVLGGYGVLTTVATWATGRVVDRVGAARLFWPGMAVAGFTVLGTALAPWLWLVAASAWLRSVPVALTSTVLYAHLAQVLRREERAPVMSLTPVPRNLAAFSIPLVTAGVATLGTTAALMVGVVVYAAAALVGRRLLAETPAAMLDRAREREVLQVEAPPGR